MEQRSDTVVVSVVCGEAYQQSFRQWYLPTWERYCRRHGFDLFLIEAPIDRNVDLSVKSIHWQKLLVASLPPMKRYARMVWIDADILINDGIAPDITAGVPEGSIGVVDATPWMTEADDVFNQYGRFLFLDALSMSAARGADGRRVVVADMSVADMYRLKGLVPPCDRFINTGVFVCSPRLHGDFLFDVYLRYGRDLWDFENSAMSWEILRSGMQHFIDPRFNAVWIWEAAKHYPFLYDLDFYNANHDVVRRCVNACFRNNFFLHFASREAKLLPPVVDTGAPNVAASVVDGYAARSAGIDFMSCSDAERALASGEPIQWPF
ncbi:hypothetical protein [Arenibaculum pallidiluteum]|uniref:hypothetical protein n=1 Tax=Arenibaculum pallidiluteum TaxID=2812559 RepID=UPI001A96A2E8|nr:hypothetical protein [Arenibaculum pallidiluteum]